jgi:uncharacterized protein YjbI with pentapeptide repeats
MTKCSPGVNADAIPDPIRPWNPRFRANSARDGNVLFGFDAISHILPSEMAMLRSSPKKIDKPISTPTLAPTQQLVPWVDATLVENEVYSNLSATKFNLSNQTAARVKFDGVDLRFTQCDLANADWHGAKLRRVELIECRMIGFTVTEGKLQDCVFTNCNASYMRSRFAALRAVHFGDCNLRDADFQGADLSGVDFTRCDLRNAQMSGAKLKGTSLRGSNIDGLIVNGQDLEGVIVDPMQAAYLAPLLGLKVVW